MWDRRGSVKKTFGIFRRSFGWVKGLHREAALDSMRNVLAVVGGATILADFTTVKAWLVAPMLVMAFVIWLLDYERHFYGKTVERGENADHASVAPSPNGGMP
jgi:hypothetical protein